MGGLAREEVQIEAESVRETCFLRLNRSREEQPFLLYQATVPAGERAASLREHFGVQFRPHGPSGKVPYLHPHEQRRPAALRARERNEGSLADRQVTDPAGHDRTRPPAVNQFSADGVPIIGQGIALLSKTEAQRLRRRNDLAVPSDADLAGSILEAQQSPGRHHRQGNSQELLERNLPARGQEFFLQSVAGHQPFRPDVWGSGQVAIDLHFRGSKPF